MPSFDSANPVTSTRPLNSSQPTPIIASGTAIVAKAIGVKWENGAIGPSRSSNTPMPNMPPNSESAHNASSGSHMLMRELSWGSVFASPQNVTTIMRVV